MKTICSILFIAMLGNAFCQTKEYVRKPYVCDYCNEAKFKPVDISTLSKAEEVICGQYWFTYSRTAPVKVTSEIIFRGDKTLQIMYANGQTFEGTYTISNPEVYQLNSTKTTNRVQITAMVYGMEFFPDGLKHIYSIFGFSGEYLYTGATPDNVAYRAGRSSAESLIDQAQKRKTEEASKEAIVTYIGAEFVGYCLIHFKTDAGEDLHFKNANITAYKSTTDECKLAEQYAGKKFKITYKLGDIEVYSEDSGETEIIQDYIITSLTAID